jgi:phospholipid/cholesterol/gamma-HCH transport system substrate-binding protein
MKTSQTSLSNKLKVGLFTIAGLVLIVLITVYVNDKPYWWRPCQLVRINVEDATGLKTKSPIRSLGIEIGYLETVELTETHVTLGICITAPVEVLPATRAYIRSEGFLGDKFVELKPVRYLGTGGPTNVDYTRPKSGNLFAGIFEQTAYADEAAYAATSPSDGTIVEDQNQPRPKRSGREIPVATGGSEDVQHLVNRVDDLVNEMTHLTTNLKTAINPDELRETMKQLNKTLENASKTLSPEGGLNQTAQRTLAKLEDSIEQLRDMMTRVNQGKGSVGMLLNDPSYALQIREAIESLNKLLNKVNKVRFVVDVGAQEILGYNSSRAWFRLGIWPNPSRYYLLGVSVDPRGKVTQTATSTTVQAGGQSVTTNTNQVTTEETGLIITAMLGKLFFNDRLDAAVGALNGDGALSLGLRFGPLDQPGRPELLRLTDDIYSHSSENGLNNRVTLTLRPFWATYAMAGLESIHQVNGQLPWFFGAGLSFDDEDIKILFTLR